MRKIKITLIALFLLIPTAIKADTITCDDSNFNYGDEFACYISVTNQANYDVLSGTVTTDPNIKCEIEGVGSGLTANQVASPKQQFSLKGTPGTNNIIKLGCSVTAKLATSANSQIVINDFKYHIVGTAVDPTELVLRSSYITVNAYEEKEEPTVPDTKPRDTSNNDSLLRSIYDENLNISFSKFITIYDIEVLYEVEQLNIIALAVNRDANVRIVGNQKLSLGKNVIDIYVTSPDGETTTCYTLNINRLARGKEIYYPKSDSTLESMTVIGQSINFQKDLYEYSIHLDSDTDKVEVNPTPTNKDATVEISDTNNLKDGSVIVVTVTSADGTSETKYRINVKRDLPKEDIKLYLFLGGVVIGGLIIVFMIIKTNKKEKEDPLLSIKTNKRKVKKGAQFDNSGVPELDVASNGNAAQTMNPTPEQPAPNVISANSATAAIIQAAPPTEDTNRNKVTALQSTIDLNVAAKAAPIAIAAVPVPAEQNLQVNTTTSSLGDGASTLDLSSAVTPLDLNQQVNNINTGLAPAQPVAVAAPATIQSGLEQNTNHQINPQSQPTNMINLEANHQNIAFNSAPIETTNPPQTTMMPNASQPVQTQVIDPYQNTNLYADQTIINQTPSVQTISLDQAAAPINSAPQQNIVEQAGQIAQPTPMAAPQPVQTIQLDQVGAPVQNPVNPQNPTN